MNSIADLTDKYQCMNFKHKSDLVKITECPKIDLGKWPTPLSTYTRFKNFSVKRDDLSGFGRGGIKVRKLESILYYVKSRNYKGILTLVPNISNLRSDLEFYKQNRDDSLSVSLLISNVPALKSALRKKILKNSSSNNWMVGKSTFLISLKMIVKWIKLRKRKIILILPSLMHPASVMGAAGGLIELYEQFKSVDKPLPKHIVISGCTGSSAAGLFLCSEILRRAGLADIKIHTVKVFPGNMRLWIWMMLKWTKSKYGLIFSLEKILPIFKSILKFFVLKNSATRYNRHSLW